MAINAEQNQLDQANKQNEANSQSSPTTGGGAASTTTSGRVASFSSGAPQQGASGSGRFTNIQKYLGANQGSGEQLGSRITGTIDKKLDKTTKEADTSSIGKAVNAEKIRLAEGTQFNDQIKQDPTQIANDTAAKDRFGNLLNNQNVASGLKTQAQTASDQANSQFNQLSQQIQNLGTEQGRFNLLQNTIRSPQYSTGQQRLDQLFLQAGNPNQLVQSQRDMSRNLNATRDQFGNAIQGLNTQISDADKQAAEVSAMLGGTLGTETQSLIDAQNKQARDLNTNNASANSAIEQFFASGYGTLNNTQKQLVDSMLSSGQLSAGMRTYNVLSDPGSFRNYVTSGSVNNTGADVLDANEYSRYNALYNLAGGTGDKVYAQAGTGGSQANIKANELSSAIQNARSNLENSLNTGVTSNNYGSYVANANLLDLLKYQENRNQFGTSTNGWGTGEIVPINVNSTINGSGVPVTAHNQTGMGSNIYYDQLGRTIYPDAGNSGANYAVDQLIRDYLNRINSAGYNNGLGGVTPGYASGDKTFNVK